MTQFVYGSQAHTALQVTDIGGIKKWGEKSYAKKKKPKNLLMFSHQWQDQIYSVIAIVIVTVY